MQQQNRRSIFRPSLSIEDIEIIDPDRAVGNFAKSICDVHNEVYPKQGLPRPVLQHLLSTVSTDDAYVNGYVTFVAPRVSGQVARVLVDDNNRVKKGHVLVELDPKQYQVQVAIKQAAVDNAQANLVLAQANVAHSLTILRNVWPEERYLLCAP